LTSEPVRQLFAAPIDPVAEPDISPSFVEMARVVASIAATRILLLIAVLTGAAIWVWTVVDPSHDRIYAAVAFSLVFVGPQVLLFWRRG
jgi:hypothetical protein